MIVMAQKKPQAAGSTTVVTTLASTTAPARQDKVESAVVADPPESAGQQPAVVQESSVAKSTNDETAAGAQELSQRQELQDGLIDGNVLGAEYRVVSIPSAVAGPQHGAWNPGVVAAGQRVLDESVPKRFELNGDMPMYSYGSSFANGPRYIIFTNVTPITRTHNVLTFHNPNP